MKIANLLSSPWAIQSNKMDEIIHTYRTHLAGDKVDFKSIENKLKEAMHGGSSARDSLGYYIENGVAIISMQGILLKQMNSFMSFYFGGTSTQDISNFYLHALDNSEVKSIIIHADTPGGTVDGTDAAAKVLLENRGRKPTVTLADGLMASAGVWLGSATDATYLADRTTAVGSVGVVSTLVSYAKMYEEVGIDVVEIYAGKYKRINSQYAPLTKEGKAYEQSNVDYLYSIFVEVLAEHKDVSVQTVLDDMAEAKMFTGQQAIDSGLADGFATMDELIGELSSGKPLGFKTRTQDATGVVEQDSTITTEDNTMSGTENKDDNVKIDKAYILENHPELAASFSAEGKASVDVGSASESAAAGENKRIQDVMAQSMPGHEALIQKLAFDGKTTGPEAAVQVLQAEKAITKTKSTDISSDASEIPEIAPAAPAAPAASSKADNSHLPLEDRCKADWKADASLRAEFGDDYEAYFYFEEANAEGLIKIQGAK